MWNERLKTVGIPRSADQEVIDAIVDAMDPITLWRWKKAIDERAREAEGMTEAPESEGNA